MSVEDHKRAMREVACPAPGCKVKAGNPCRGVRKKGRVHPSRIKAFKNPDAVNAARLSRADQRKSKMERKSDREVAKGFYRSWEWKKVRYEALKVHGRRCQCCGWKPGDTKEGHLVVDHILPRRKRPDLQLDLSNLQVLCNDCNMGKSNVHEDDFRSIDQLYKATIQ